jgi:DNA-binding MarR family transcriptional regulator
MSEVIEEARGLLQGRLDELEVEKSHLSAAIKELPTNGVVKTRRSPGRPRKAAGTSRAVRAAAKVGGKPKVARKKRSGTRAEQAVSLVTAAGKEGISANDIAKTMKIKPNYLYRVMGDLEKEGRVKKDGRTYFPA